MSEEKTICFFSGDITRSGGTERVATMVANGLMREKRYRICFASLTEQEEQPFYSIDERIPRCAFSRKWMNPGPGYLKILPRLRRYLRENRIDVIIDIDIVLDVLSLPAAWGLPVKVISWEHFNYSFEQKSLYRRQILRWSVRRSDYVVTLTQCDLENYRKYLGRKDRVCAIPNPVWDPHREHGGTSVACGENAASEKMEADAAAHQKNWIITPARLVPEKGIDYLVRVAGEVLNNHPDWQWLVLGDGGQKEFLEEEIRIRHLEGRLIAEGKVNNVYGYLKQAKLFVLTSRTEALPMGLLEARAAGLPCVSFATMADPADAIMDGENGYLIRPFDCSEMAEKIGRLLENEPLRTRFSDAAARGMEKYRPEQITAQWNRVIETVCQKEGPENGRSGESGSYGERDQR